MHYGMMMQMIMPVMKKKIILLILAKESLPLDDNDDENSASTANTLNLIQNASMQLNKEDRNACVTCAYENSSGSNDNDTFIEKNIFLILLLIVLLSK